jgi:hypothetical protein
MGCSQQRALSRSWKGYPWNGLLFFGWRGVGGQFFSSWQIFLFDVLFIHRQRALWHRQAAWHGKARQGKGEHSSVKEYFLGLIGAGQMIDYKASKFLCIWEMKIKSRVILCGMDIPKRITGELIQSQINCITFGVMKSGETFFLFSFSFLFYFSPSHRISAWMHSCKRSLIN